MLPNIRFIRTLAIPLCVGLPILSLSATRVLAEPVDRAEIESAISAVKPALVRIFVAEVEYDQGREVKMQAAGSGVIVSHSGYVVTNHHVAGKAKRLFCTLSNRERVDADLIGTDTLTDIAVIKLRAPGRDFPTAQWGDSSKLLVGDRVFAMGSPLALSQSVTMGIVSNTEMVMPDFLGESMTLDGEDVGSMVRWIGHDATIMPGNSGGPLVNDKGQIVGLNEISFGLGGAIPSNLVREVSDAIIKSGKVSRSWIGLSVQPLLKSSKLEKGVLVSSVMPGSPAKTAGFKPGDIITKIAGEEVNVRYAEELPVFNHLVASLPIGQETEAAVLRAGVETTLKVKTAERPEAEPKRHELKQWGMCASNLSVPIARELKRGNTDGVLIDSIRPGGPCGDAKPGLDSDDVIVEANGRPVKTVQDLIAITESLTKGKSDPVPVLVAFEREAERLLTVVKVGIQDFQDPGREVRKAYLPIATQVLTSDIADALGVSGRTGVRVTQVFPNSSAQKAGLKVGDLIVKLDGNDIEASQPEDSEVFPTMIRQYKIGSKANLAVIRNGKVMQIPVVLEESRPLPREMKKYRDENFEFTARSMSFQDRVGRNIDKEVVGVLIDEVTEGGWAALSKLEVGDILRTVDGESISDAESLRSVMQKVAEKKPKYVIFRVQRGIDEQYVELETDWTEGK